jgi:hypothetical protein
MQPLPRPRNSFTILPLRSARVGRNDEPHRTTRSRNKEGNVLGLLEFPVDVADAIKQNEQLPPAWSLDPFGFHDLADKIDDDFLDVALIIDNELAGDAGILGKEIGVRHHEQF